MAEQSRKERQRENFEKIPDADLFFVDSAASSAPSGVVDASSEAAEASHSSASVPSLSLAPRLSKKELARSRSLRAEAILAASRAAVPVASTLVGRSGDKRERARAAAARPAALRKKFGSTRVAKWLGEGEGEGKAEEEDEVSERGGGVEGSGLGALEVSLVSKSKGKTKAKSAGRVANDTGAIKNATSGKSAGKSDGKSGVAHRAGSSKASVPFSSSSSTMVPPPAALRDGTPSEDPWDVPAAFKKHHRALIAAGALSARVPVGERRRRLPSLAANRQAAVVSKRAVDVVGSGLSYNPEAEAHAEALAEAVAAAVQEDLKKELAPQAPPTEVDREAVELATRQDEAQLLDLLEGHGKAFFDNVMKKTGRNPQDDEDEDEDEGEEGEGEQGEGEDGDEEDDEEVDGDQENSTEEASSSSLLHLLPPSSRPKTKADRLRQRRHKDAVEAMRRASRQKAASRDLQHLGDVLETVAEEEAERERLRLRREADALERAKAPPKRVGGGVFVPLPSRVLLTEEVGKPLRLLRPMPALALERFKSLQERGLVAVPIKRKTKKHKIKRIEYMPGSRGEADLEAKQAADEERALRKKRAKAQKKAHAAAATEPNGVDW